MRVRKNIHMIIGQNDLLIHTFLFLMCPELITYPFNMDNKIYVSIYIPEIHIQ